MIIKKRKVERDFLLRLLLFLDFFRFLLLFLVFLCVRGLDYFFGEPKKERRVDLALLIFRDNRGDKVEAESKGLVFFFQDVFLD